ncbi:Lsr2 family protein [Kineococcus sp. LSe6-4]|uniref:Lsr2 family protein n=1 Tax=Kineococcus halophytocola TaxID=3234027 RepID=A0ABV4GX39_9ACTN
MVQRTGPRLTDDGDQPQDPQPVQTVRFGLDGLAYEIDLTASDAAALRRALAPYVEHGRVTPARRAGATRRRGGTGAGPVVDSAAVRAWARKRGVPVTSRGRVPAGVIEQYLAATAPLSRP